MNTKTYTKSYEPKTINALIAKYEYLNPNHEKNPISKKQIELLREVNDIKNCFQGYSALFFCLMQKDTVFRPLFVSITKQMKLLRCLSAIIAQNNLLPAEIELIKNNHSGFYKRFLTIQTTTSHIIKETPYGLYYNALQKEEDGFFSIIEKYDIRDKNTYTTILAEEFFKDAEIYNKNHPVEFAAYDKERKKLIERRETATARKIKEQKEQKEIEKLIKKAQKAEEKEIRNNEIKNRQRDRYLGIAGDYHHYHTRKIPKNHILHQVTNMDIER